MRVCRWEALGDWSAVLVVRILGGLFGSYEKPSRVLSTAQEELKEPCRHLRHLLTALLPLQLESGRTWVFRKSQNPLTPSSEPR